MSAETSSSSTSGDRQDADGNWLSVFTPSQTPPEHLEAILVQRHAVLEDAVERVRESADSGHKHHLLYVGSRGTGKTHLLTLILYRVRQDVALRKKLRVAWLSEDETSTTLLELLVKIYAALEKNHPQEFPSEAMAEVYGRPEREALPFARKTLLEALGVHTLLLAAENLDALFENLGARGQHELRAFLQENPRVFIVGTAQRLVEGVADREQPFFGFFQTTHMKPLMVEDATVLLQRIAQLQKNPEVVEFLATSRGRARVRALHHLSGGNHRIYVVLGQFITRDSVDALVGPFLKMVDDLTPYYQERLRWLPAQQRKIVEYLCRSEGTVPVKEIAQRIFASQQTVSSQLQDLRDKGYVESNQRGRESLYEMSEPLMRICVEVKENRPGQLLRLLVDFLRVWYEDDDLKLRLDGVKPSSLECAYLRTALERNQAEGNLRVKLMAADLRKAPENLDILLGKGWDEELQKRPEEVLMALKALSEGRRDEALGILDNAVETEGNNLKKALFLIERSRFYETAGERKKQISDCTTVIGLPQVTPAVVGLALLGRGMAYALERETQKAMKDFSAVVEMAGADPLLVAGALCQRGAVYLDSSQASAAVADFTAAIEAKVSNTALVAMAYSGRGTAYYMSENLKQAISDFTSAVELADAPEDEKASALMGRGIAYVDVGNDKKALKDFSRVITMDDASKDAVAVVLLNRGFLYERNGQPSNAVADYDALIGMEHSPAALRVLALFNRAVIRYASGKPAQAIDDYTTVIEMREASANQVVKALVNRGGVFFKAQQFDAAETDYTAVLNSKEAPSDQIAIARLNLGLIYASRAQTERAVAELTNAINLKALPNDALATALFCRGDLMRRLDDQPRAVEDYTSVVTLEGAPVEMVAKALFIRGVLFRVAGDRVRAIEDATAAMEWPEAPPDFKARCLLCRGIVYGEVGDYERAIADLSAVIHMVGAAVEDVARAHLVRSMTLDRQDSDEDTSSDVKAVIKLKGAPAGSVAIAFLKLAETSFIGGQWKEGMDWLRQATRDKQRYPLRVGSTVGLVGAVFRAGLNPEGRREKARELLEIYDVAGAQTKLGEGLIQHLGQLHQSGEALPSTDNLEDWSAAWEEEAASFEDFRLVLRLLRVGVNFLKTGGKDSGVLLDLIAPERKILEQTFGLK